MSRSRTVDAAIGRRPRMRNRPFTTIIGTRAGRVASGCSVAPAEYLERSFAHVYDTGALRRTHLRGHRNILKPLLVHARAFSLGLLMRRLCCRGTLRGLQGSRVDPRAFHLALFMLA